MRKCWIFYMLVIFGSPAYSQYIYYTKSDSVVGNFDILELDINTCQSTVWCDTFQKSEFYVRPEPHKFSLIQQGVFGQIFTWKMKDHCHPEFKVDQIIQPTFPHLIGNAMTSDQYGRIWLFDDGGVGIVNPPSPYFNYRYYPERNKYLFGGGGTTLFEGKIYVGGTDVSDPLGRFSIFEVDTTDLKVIRVVRTFEKHEKFVRPLCPLHVSCGKSYLIANNFEEMYYLDVKTGNLSLFCTLVNNPPHTRHVQGGASSWPYDPADCDVYLDLDINGSSGNLKKGFRTSMECKRQKLLLSDQDVDVFSNYGTLDSISVELMNSPDMNQEWIKMRTGGNFAYNELLHKIVIFPSGMTANADYEQAIRNLEYFNNAAQITIGMRRVRIIAYKDELRDTVYSDLDIKGPFYYAGEDAELKLCRMDSLVNMEELLGPHTVSGKWNHGNGVLNLQTDSSRTYYYIVGDSICGLDSAQVNVELLERPVYDLGPDTGLCPGDSIVYVVPAQYNALWQDMNTSMNYIINTPGKYILILTNADGCIMTDSMEVFGLHQEIIKQVVERCANEKLDYKGITYTAGSTIYDTLPSLVSCDTLLEIYIKPLPLPMAAISGDSLVCSGDSSWLNAIGVGRYRWSTGDTSRAIRVGAGNYVLIITDENLCSDTSSFELKEASVIQYVIEPFDPVCPEESGKVDIHWLSGGIAPIEYELNGHFSSNGVYSNLQPGKYIVQIKDALGCTRIDSVQIFAAPEFEVDLADKIVLDVGSSVIVYYHVKKGSLMDLQIIPSEGIQREADGLRISGGVDREYILKFINEAGCEIERKLIVTIRKQDEVFVPSVFSPNGDGVNDIWLPHIGNAWVEADLSIFNRWGGLLASNDASLGWDGRTRDSECLPGVYIYHLMLKDSSGKTESRTGELTLIR